MDFEITNNNSDQNLKIYWIIRKSHLLTYSFTIMNLKNSALLIIDMQYDFMENGSLEVAQANQLIDPINQLMQLDWGLIVASQDWHPENHISFAENHSNKSPFETITLKDGAIQTLWPTHCVQNSHGAEIHDKIAISKTNQIVKKGQNTAVDSYSAFFDNNHQIKTDLDAILKNNQIKETYIVGLAADYCVKFTAIDSAFLGYTTNIILDATKFIDPTIKVEYQNELNCHKINFISSKTLFNT